MSIGTLILTARQKYGRGLRVAWYRDVVRPRILNTPPVPDTHDLACEIHVLTSQDDLLNLLWALKSFYRFSAERYALCIHDDGTLTPGSRLLLNAHFPAARFIDRARADAEVLPALAAYPRSLAFRRSNHLAPKIFDFAHYLRSPRMLLLDSDLLFFSRPHALLDRIADPHYRRNAFNADIESAYTVEPETARSLAAVDLAPDINSGLALVHQDSLRLDWFEEFLALPGVLGHFWRIEQTLYALAGSRFGVDLLPGEYRVRLANAADTPCVRHYVGQVRHLMYSEGIRRLVRAGFLEQFAAPLASTL